MGGGIRRRASLGLWFTLHLFQAASAAASDNRIFSFHGSPFFLLFEREPGHGLLVRPRGSHRCRLSCNVLIRVRPPDSDEIEEIGRPLQITEKASVARLGAPQA
jgi:hypothetical protein